MQKKYQVFISSTYIDLKDERQDIIRSVLDLNHIPSGMEAFPASDQEQFRYIKKAIDECDYYVLVIGGRYGSIDSSGISYTEKEYNYAVEKKLTVLAFIHDNVKSIPVGMVDVDPEKVSKLESFVDKVSSGRLVSFWNNKQDLRSKVLIALSRAFAENPGVGWIRASSAASEEILSQINQVRNDFDALKEENDRLKKSISPSVTDIAPLSDFYSITYSYQTYGGSGILHGRDTLRDTWENIFISIGPSIFKPSDPKIISASLSNLIREVTGRAHLAIDKSCLDVVKIHLRAANLIKIEALGGPEGKVSEFVSITELGEQKLIEKMTVRSTVT